MINKITIIGVGLIGGSLAKALKNQQYVKHITGFSRNENKLKTAKNLGIIDNYNTDLATAINDADVIVIATPVASFTSILTQILPFLNTKTLITDVGSTKAGIVALANQILGKRVGQFVAGHPIAGKEKSGVEAANADLFKAKKIILTPNAKNQNQAIATITNMWQATHAEVIQMDAKKHDEILAATSHLPHILAFALMDYLFDKEDNICQYAAGGFKDFSRIASSNATMWADIAISNKEAILTSISQYQEKLNQLASLIKNQNKTQLKSIFQQAKDNRDNWLKTLD